MKALRICKVFLTNIHQLVYYESFSPTLNNNKKLPNFRNQPTPRFTRYMIQQTSKRAILNEKL